MDDTCDHPPACPPSCTHCLAYDRHTRLLCSRVPSTSGSKWCTEHEGLQAKALKSYKRLTLVVESYDDSALPGGTENVLAEVNMSKLRSWSEAARHKWGLTQRVIVARAEHHSQYYAGGDWGHCLFVESLKTEAERLERLMRTLDRRAYALTLAKSEAEWILAAPAVNFICNEPAVNDAPLTPPPTPPLAMQTLPSTSSKNQRKKASRKAARKNSTSSTSDLDTFLSPPCCALSLDELEAHSRPLSQLNHLRAYLTPPSDLPPTIRPSTWVSLISTLFRYVILRTPSLAPLALTVSSPEGRPLVTVSDFLDLLEDRIETRCGEEVGQLWRGMKFPATQTGASGKKKGREVEAQLGVGVLGDAIAEVFRDVEKEPSVYISVLGGRVNKEASKEDLPGEGWDLFYQFISCSGCSLSITRSFASLVRNRRLAILGAYPAWLSATETQADHVFRLAYIQLCASNLGSCGKKVKRVEPKDGGGKGRNKKKAVLVEEWERAWVYMKMPLDDSWTTSTLDALAARPDRFVVLARKASTLEVTHTPSASALTDACKTPGCTCNKGPELWLGRVRSGVSPVERKMAKWTTSTFFPVDSVLDSFSKHSSPETRFNQRYTDLIDVIIMDARTYTASSAQSTTSANAEWTSFADSIAAMVVQTGGCESFKELLQKGRQEAIARGEIVAEDKECRSKQVALGVGKRGGVTYAAVDERLVAREMFRELF